ncbi:MAG: response regulator [Syntrophales bacterium]
MYALQQSIRSEPAYRPHVLLVEDEFTVAKGLEMVMTEEGYDVDLADTGQEALHKFWTKDNFDLMVADLRLPDIDGMEVIERVKEKRPETKVVIITGYPSVATAVKAVKMGVSDYLRKPFTDDEFMAVVDTAMKDRQKDSMEKLIVDTQEERLIQRQEVIQVLEKASQHQNFWQKLMENGSEALKGYRLSRAAQAAILSGDLNWIRENVGELTERQLQFIYKRLEREAW